MRCLARLYAQPDQHGVPKYYMNYLSSCDASCKGPVGGSWNGVGATISSDGVHYEDQVTLYYLDKDSISLKLKLVRVMNDPPATVLL